MRDVSANYLAITQDGFDDDGRKLSSHEIIRARLNEQLWPVYERTKNKYTISAGDTLFFYAGGKGPFGGHVIALATLGSIIIPTRRVPVHLFTSGPVDSILKLENIQELQPTRLKPFLISEGVIKEENKKWGAFLMGGFSKIPNSVANLLTRETA
jgi:hypothetical protein